MPNPNHVENVYHPEMVENIIHRLCEPVAKSNFSETISAETELLSKRLDDLMEKHDVVITADDVEAHRKSLVASIVKHVEMSQREIIVCDDGLTGDIMAADMKSIKENLVNSMDEQRQKVLDAVMGMPMPPPDTTFNPYSSLNPQQKVMSPRTAAIKMNCV